MQDTVNIKRRRLIGTAIAGIGALQLGMGEIAKAQSRASPPRQPTRSTTSGRSTPVR